MRRRRRQAPHRSGPVAAPSPKPSPCSDGATLVNNTCTCPAGTRRSLGGSQRCVPVCGAGQQLSRDGTSCVAAVLNCTGGMVPTNGACRCPPGTSPGPGGQQCFTQCPTGQTQAPDGSGTCVAVDPYGIQVRGFTCQGGSTLVNNTCTCPAGTRALGGESCAAGRFAAPASSCRRTAHPASQRCSTAPAAWSPPTARAAALLGPTPAPAPVASDALRSVQPARLRRWAAAASASPSTKWKSDRGDDHGRQLPGWLDAGEQHLHLSGRHTPLSRGGRGRAALPAELRCRPAAFAGRHVLFRHPCGGPYPAASGRLVTERSVFRQIECNSRQNAWRALPSTVRPGTTSYRLTTPP